jgi:hypothetical protein
MNHVMIDLETLGTGPDTAFVSIGAVAFDPNTGELGPELSLYIDWQSAFSAGRTVTGDTLRWWLRQSISAKEEILKEGKQLSEALLILKDFLYSVCNRNRLRVWGNGATFDISILEHAYRQQGWENPWLFWNVRDVRTIKDIGKFKVDPKIFLLDNSKAHKAIEDAKHQARYVSKLWQVLRGAYFD